MSEDTAPAPVREMTLVERLVEIRKRCGYVQKDATNTGQGYRYASAEAVLNKVRDAANDLGVATASEVMTTHFQVDEGTTRCAVHMSLKFSMGGQTVTFQGVGGGQDRGDKAVMKASTAALKYALASGLLISWGDDPEADASTDGPAKPRKTRTPKDPAVAEAKAATSRVREEVTQLLKAATTLEDLSPIKTLIQTKLTQGTVDYKDAVAEYTEVKNRLMKEVS